MAWTSPTTMNASEGITEIIEYLNSVTDFWFSRMMLVAIFIIFLFGYVRSRDDEDWLGGFAVSSYVCMVLSLILWLMRWLDGYTFGIVIAFTFVTTAGLLLDKRGVQ